MIHRATLIAALGLGALSAHAAAPFTLIARTGQSAHGIPGDVRYLTFTSTLLVNSAGEVAFQSTLSGADVQSGNNSALFFGPATQVGLLVRSGSLIPGSQSETYLTFDLPTINRPGHAALHALLGNTGQSKFIHANLAGAPGELRVIARTDQHLPDGSSLYHTLDLPLTSRTGGISFTGTYDNLPSLKSIVVPAPTSTGFGVLARTDTVAGLTGQTYVNLGPPVLSDSGTSAFWAFLSDRSEAIFVGDAAENLAQVARTGSLAPGAGASFLRLSDPTINSTGQVAFIGQLNDALEADVGLWSGAADDLKLIVRENDALPGTPHQIAGFGTPALNGQGKLALVAAARVGGVTDANRRALLVHDGQSLTNIVMTGDRVPGEKEGTVFGRITPDFSVAINGAGQLAFNAEVLPPDAPAYQALFTADPQGALRELLRMGETLNLAGQDRIVSDFRFITGTGGEDGAYRGFSDDGRLGVWVRFTDQSQALMLISVPEPTGAVILIALAATAVSRRRVTRSG